MAKYQILYLCGHTEEKQLFGPEARRQSYIAWCGEAAQCTACRKADAEAATEALEVEYGLPALQGSEKQVAWARTIRFKALREVIDYIDQKRSKAEQLGILEKFEAQAAEKLQILCRPAAARFWIDGRDVSAEERLLGAK